MPQNALRDWARLGAAARLQTLDQERQAILRVFPDLGRRKPGPKPKAAAPANGAAKPKRTMSAEGRARIAAAARKRWAEWKAKKAKA